MNKENRHLLVGFLRSLFIHRETLILENLALRQQLAAYKRTSKRPRLRMFGALVHESQA